MRNAARQNRLLAALPDADLQRLLPHLAPRKFDSGELLGGAGGTHGPAVFPTSMVVSMQVGADAAPGLEIALIGSEGVVSPPLGECTNALRPVVLQPGWGFALSPATPMAELMAEPLTRLLLRFSQALLLQAAITAACARRHSVGQQVCRWLLQRLDRTDTCELAVTQASLAATLGVRRAAVNAAAGELRDEGLIGWSRGRLTVRDPAGLDRRACNCHGLIAGEYRRLLPLPPDGHSMGASSDPDSSGPNSTFTEPKGEGNAGGEGGIRTHVTA